MLLGLFAGCSAVDPEDANHDAAEVGETGLRFADVLPEASALGVQGTVKKLVDPRLRNLADVEDQYALAIAFETLDAAHFEKLQAMFGGHSKVRYASGRRYELLDFLPPAVQALANHTMEVSLYEGGELEEHATDAAKEDANYPDLLQSGFSIMSNCYNTSLEVLRTLNAEDGAKLHFYFPDRFSSDELFTSDERSRAVTEDDLTFGDVLTVSTVEDDVSTLAHTAVVLSKELVFEKTNGSSDDAYRISLRRDVLAKYRRVPNVAFAYRRFHAPEELPELQRPANDLSEPVRTMIHTTFPSLDLDAIVLGYDMGFGGSPTPTFSVAQSSTLRFDASTGRAEIDATAEVTKRFAALRAD